MLPGLEEAAQRLHDGLAVDVWAVTGLTLATAHEYKGDKLQRSLMWRVHDFLAARWNCWSTPLERAASDSAVSDSKAPGGNDWLLARPTCKKHAFIDDAMRVLQRWRLRTRL
eukprot:951643-Karenia_brevis.AAC.1